MVISYYGLGCFKIQTKDLSLVIDPYSFEKHGFKDRLEGDIFLLREDFKENSKEGFLISSPGEYEIKDCFIYGLPFLDKEKKINIIYKIEIENIKLVHLNKLNQNLNNEIIEKITNPDILIIPVGGKEVLTANKAAELASQLEAKLIIPTYYKIPQLKLDFNSVDDFLKEISIKKEFLEKLKINKRDLEKKIVVLKCLI